VGCLLYHQWPVYRHLNSFFVITECVSLVDQSLPTLEAFFMVASDVTATCHDKSPLTSSTMSCALMVYVLLGDDDHKVCGRLY